MVVVLHLIAACCGGYVELVAAQLEVLARCGKRTVELVAGIFHPVLRKGRLQAAFVKRTVVGDKRQPLDQRLNLCPYLGEGRLPVGVTARQAMHFSGPVGVIIGGRLDEAVEPVDNLAAAHHNNADAAHARPASVGRLEIYCNKVSHNN